MAVTSSGPQHNCRMSTKEISGFLSGVVSAAPEGVLSSSDARSAVVESALQALLRAREQYVKLDSLSPTESSEISERALLVKAALKECRKELSILEKYSLESKEADSSDTNKVHRRLRSFERGLYRRVKKRSPENFRRKLRQSEVAKSTLAPAIATLGAVALPARVIPQTISESKTEKTADEAFLSTEDPLCLIASTDLREAAPIRRGIWNRACVTVSVLLAAVCGFIGITTWGKRRGDSADSGLPPLVGSIYASAILPSSSRSVLSRSVASVTSSQVKIPKGSTSSNYTNFVEITPDIIVSLPSLPSPVQSEIGKAHELEMNTIEDNPAPESIAAEQRYAEGLRRFIGAYGASNFVTCLAPHDHSQHATTVIGGGALNQVDGAGENSQHSHGHSHSVVTASGFSHEEFRDILKAHTHGGSAPGVLDDLVAPHSHFISGLTIRSFMEKHEATTSVHLRTTGSIERTQGGAIGARAEAALSSDGQGGLSVAGVFPLSQQLVSFETGGNFIVAKEHLHEEDETENHSHEEEGDNEVMHEDIIPRDGLSAQLWGGLAFSRGGSIVQIGGIVEITKSSTAPGAYLSFAHSLPLKNSYLQGHVLSTSDRTAGALSLQYYGGDHDTELSFQASTRKFREAEITHTRYYGDFSLGVLARYTSGEHDFASIETITQPHQDRDGIEIEVSPMYSISDSIALKGSLVASEDDDFEWKVGAVFTPKNLKSSMFWVSFGQENSQRAESRSAVVEAGAGIRF